ncbi:MAG TPA: sugar ABC transporter permease [Candidatus Limnocylindria bacterium]|nr:sugar ABC transporter permease [Candidatus Limnocylindria bacterium]
MKRRRRRTLSYAKYGYIFSLPFVLAFLVFSLYPTLYTAVIGFTDMKGLTTTTFNFLEDPLANFRTILNNASFRLSLGNTVKIWVINFIPQILLALLLTAWFTSNHNRIKGQGFFKVVFYMPNIITAATIAILFNVLFGYPMGPVNDTLVKAGILGQPYYFLSDKLASQLIISFIQFWMWYGYTMIVLISGVLGINPEIYEAADIDGASDVQTFFYITVPNLRTILLFVLITSMIGGLNMFDIPRLFNLGNPGNATLTTSLFIYNQAFSGSYFFNRAAAASMIMFAIIAAFSVLTFFLMRDRREALARREQKRLERAARRGEGGTRGAAR